MDKGINLNVDEYFMLIHLKHIENCPIAFNENLQLGQLVDFNEFKNGKFTGNKAKCRIIYVDINLNKKKTIIQIKAKILREIGRTTRITNWM